MSVQEDRRDVKSQRIPFEAIVELGDDDPGAAFEAQGVNLSANGMQLRTAYLPEVGQQLLCRFGSGAQEIQAEADVVWTKHAGRGGEFGIRFSKIDGASAAALWDLCGHPRPDANEESEPLVRTEADEGTRVRLHIDGLSSPMKARVRGAVGKELLVGSNLEFLKVGRAIELENVDQGGKRPAHIDRVDVELDRETRVPQLVVTLRYDDMSADPPPVAAEPSSPPPYFPPSIAVSTSASPCDVSSEAPTVERPVASVAPPPPPAAAAASSAGAATSDGDRTPEEIELEKMMRSKASIVASDAMVKVADLGVRAKLVLGEAFAKAWKARSGANPAEPPRRKTSPPPGGALHASGKRVVRESEEAGDDAGDGEKPKMSRKTMLLAGGATGAALLVTLLLVTRGPSSPPPGENKAAETAAAAAVPAPVETSAPANGVVEAKVPLFGATVVATAEVPAVTANAPMSAPTAPATPINRTLAFGGSPSFGDASEPPAASRSSDADNAKSRGKAAPFGHGKLEHALVFRIKTDGTIGDLHGVRTSGGFTLTLPGRKTLETGAALAARDPRIAKVSVANNAKGSELTFHFKGGVPAYLVSPNGRELSLSLSRAESQGGKDGVHHSSTAQKRGADTSHRSNKH
jgi:hypothetical protein